MKAHILRIQLKSQYIISKLWCYNLVFNNNIHLTKA